MAFQKSERQLAIENTWLNTDKSILCGAVAGSGKTTTLLGLLELMNKRTLFLAFNKTIQEEIQNRIDEKGITWAKAMTMHSLGLTAIRKVVKTTITINGNKNYLLSKDFFKKYKKSFKGVPYEEQLTLGYALSDLNDASRMFLTNDLEELIDHLENMDKCSVWFLDPELETYWERYMEIREDYYNYLPKRELIIDFADMLYLPVVKDLPIPVAPKLLMLDEVQDFNLCQHAIIDKIMAQGKTEKFIAVGDRNQAIYGFAGASAKSFDSFSEKPNVVELPLDICYRCPPNIVNQANLVYKVMNAFKTKNGKLGNVTNIEEIKEGGLIVCRNVKPLIELYFKMLAKEQLVTIIGDDIQARVNKILKPYKDYTAAGAKREVIIRIDELKHKRGEEEKKELYFLKENQEILDLLVENLCEPYDMVSYLMKKLVSIFNNKDIKTKMCSIHKSKGLEADVVYILNEKATIPSKFAISPSQKVQEQNLKYVARTRAKEELYYLNLE
tara:strand:+ start:144 stop:1640 length:1497 start_codon:yes stop_codon:yes gene_type:complete